MDTIWLTGAQWLAVLRIGLGLWWLESWRHKDRKGWFERGTGIAWAADIAAKHRWSAVRSGFDAVVAPRPRAMAYVVVYAELALGLGLVAGFLTPIALVGRPAAEPPLLHPHDPRLGRAGAERDDGADLGGRPLRDGLAELVAGRRAGVVLMGGFR
jgi:hypothetical protein